ncbi:MAG: hypothetical protein ABJG41_09975 [Cyclobacteriaceae bacterium]
MTDQEFCKLYSAFYGDSGIEAISSPKQLTFVKLSGVELKELVEHFVGHASPTAGSSTTCACGVQHPLVAEFGACGKCMEEKM